MNGNRLYLARRLAVWGAIMLAVGLLLLIVRLVMFLAWYVAGAIAAAGALLLLIGMILLPSGREP